MVRRIAAPLFAVLLLFPACAPEDGGSSGEEGSEADVTMTLPVTTGSEEARSHFMQGMHALDMGRPRDARDHFEQAVELDPEFALAHRFRVFTGTSLGSSMSALAEASEHKGTASEAERQLIEITEAARRNDTEGQLEIARALAESHPESPRAWLQLAGIQNSMDRTEAARESMQRAIEQAPDFAPAHMQLGNSYLFDEPRDMGRAEEAFRTAVELAPDEAMPHDLLADAYRMQGRLEDAAGEYGQAAQLDPDDALPLQQRGHVHSFLGNYEQARADYDSAIALGQDDEPATFGVYRAFVHVHQGNPGAAVEELDELLGRIDGMDLPGPRGPKIFALTSQAQIALHAGMLEKAEEALSRREELVMANAEDVGTEQARRSTEAEVLEWEARLAARRGDFESAMSLCREAMSLREPIRDPTKNYGVHEAMGLVHLLQGNHGEAVDHYEQADPGDIYATFHHARALEGAGETEAAMEMYRKVADWRFNALGLALTRDAAMEKVSGA